MTHDFLGKLQAAKQAAKPETNGHPPAAPYVPQPGDDARARAYATAALRDECDELAALPPDSRRNTKLNEAAFNLARFINDNILTQDEVTAALITAARTAGLPDHEINTCLRGDRQTHDAAAKPRQKPSVPPPKTPKPEPSTPTEGRQIRWMTASQVQDAIPVWAWRYGGKGRIQLGTLALFAGRPGAGKSTAARWFTAQATTGALEGCWDRRPQHVAYIATAEESARYTITPGLRAAGADLTKVHFPTVFNEQQPVQLLSTLDEHNLTEYLLNNHITVVVCDPLMSTITANTDINKNNETRAQIQPWARIADRINGVVIGVAHLRKSGTGDVVAAITGSSAFGEVARAVFGFAKNMVDDTRVMSQHKNSTGYEDLSLTYEIESQPVTVATGETTEVGKFIITGDSELTVEDILSDSTMAGGANLECQRWLEDYLTQQGCSPSKDVKVEAHKEIGVSMSSVDRAAKKLRVTIESRGFPRRTYWSLPDAVASYDPSQSRRSHPHE